MKQLSSYSEISWMIVPSCFGWVFEFSFSSAVIVSALSSCLDSPPPSALELSKLSYSLLSPSSAANDQNFYYK